MKHCSVIATMLAIPFEAHWPINFCNLKILATVKTIFYQNNLNATVFYGKRCLTVVKFKIRILSILFLYFLKYPLWEAAL